MPIRSADELTFGRKLLFSAAAAGMLALLLAVLAAAGEAFMRSLAPKSDPVKLGVRLEGSSRPYGLLPNARLLQTGALVETNSLGFRDREYAPRRTPGVVRIAVLGDSFTFGTGVALADTYAKRLEARIREGWQPVEVINFGVGGYNTVAELATWREQAARFNPDLVVLGYVLNDTERLSADGLQAGGRSPSLLARLHRDLKDVSMLYRYLAPKAGGVLALFNARYALGTTREMLASYDEGAPGWIESRAALLELAREVRASGAEFMVAVFPMMLDFARYPLEPAHAKIAAFCREHGIEVIDLLPRLRGENAAELAVFLDGHPNAGAHAIFADALYGHVRQRYADLRAGRLRAAPAPGPLF